MSIAINHISLRPLSWIKTLFVRPGVRPRRVPIGLYKGITLELDLTSQTQAWLSLYERETHPYIRMASERASWLIDVGAARGELSAFFLKKTNARVVAVEPRESVLSCLARTVERNALDPTRLTTIQDFAAASDENGVRLDSIAVDRKRRGFIKIDVDGFELDVLEGATGLIREAEVDLLIEVHSPDLEARTLAFLRGHGYTPKIVRNAPWRVFLPEQRPVELNRWVWAQR